MSVVQRGSKFQARVKEPDGGKYHRVSFDTKEQALFWERKAREAIRKGLPVSDSSDSETVSIRSLATKYSRLLWPNQREKMIDYDLRVADRLLPSDPLKITSRDIKQYVHARTMEGVSDTTIRVNLTRIKKLLKHSHDMGDIYINDELWKDWPKFTAANNRIRYLSTEEEEVLLKAMNIDDYRFLTMFMIDTGCRPSEVQETQAVVAKPFEWRDISYSKDGRTLVTFWKTKTNTPRTVPLTERAREALEWSREEGHRRPFDVGLYRHYKDYVVETATKVGFDDVVVYTFRHTCASRLVQRGADIMRVKQWMGHSNVETTLGYAHLAPEDIYTLSDLL